MKIILQPPFTNDFKSGYLLTNKEPRNLISLIRNDNSQTSISYARYLMSCHLNRYLLKTEHVDHIDNNKMNDVIENLQILSISENNEKSRKHLNITKRYESYICPICKKEFNTPYNRVVFKFSENSNYQPCCSRSCGGKKSQITLKTKLSTVTP